MTRRFSLRIHPAGGAMFLLAMLFCDSGEVLAAAAALLAHEGAHLLVMVLCGVRRCAVELTPFGGMADAACFERLSPLRQAAVALAGVACSACIAWACWRFAPDTRLWYALFCVSASLALVNCLPAYPLDGARALIALASALGVDERARKALVWLAYAVSAGMAGLGLYGVWLGHVNLSLLLMGPYLAYAAHENQTTQTVRRMQRAGETRRKLSSGGMMPLRAYAMAGEPGRTEAARLLRDANPQRYQVVLMIDERTGHVRGALTEQELAERLFAPRREEEHFPRASGKRREESVSS